MKINQIKIEHFLGIQHLNISLDHPITLFAGRNGSGKSSIAEAVRFALVGEHDREKLKKDFKHMITEGQKKGRIELIVEDDAAAIEFNCDIAKGPSSKEPYDQFLPFTLDPKKFAGLTAIDRRNLLFRLTGCTSTKEDVRKRLEELGCDEKKCERIMPLMRSGFDAASTEAANMARDSRVIWKSITREAYGAMKAQTWTAEAFPLTEDQEKALASSNMLEEVEQKIALSNEKIGGLREKYAQLNKIPDEIHALQEQVLTIEALEKTVEIQKQNLDQYRTEAEEVRKRASGMVAPNNYECPECHAELMFYIDELQPYKFDDKEADKEAQEELPRHEEGLKKLSRAHDSTIQRLNNANNAAQKVKELNKEYDDAPAYGKDIAVLQTAITQLEETKKKLSAEIDAAKKLQRDAQEADKNTKLAKANHLDAVAWAKIADALAPDGIPAEILSGALRPINELLSDSAKTTGWKIPLIDGNIEIEADGRPYRLLSESEKWLVDAMIAEVISNLSGLKMIALDRFDVLDLPSRSRLIAWLSKLADAGDIEMALILGTLKAQPSRLPGNVAAHWIENGGIATQQEAA
jgi:DNA polymerase III delta prime subunit